MKRIAIVVQRHHESVVGGSESLAWQYASLLRDEYDVDLLTTTATAISDWANVLPEGAELKDGVVVRRFPVTIGRTLYWGLLHDRMKQDYRPLDAHGRRSFKTLKTSRYQKWSLSFQEEFIRMQGPYSVPLMEYLRERWADYRAIIFVTYLYPTTYFGLWQVPERSALLAPTLHNEAPAYFSAYHHAARRAHSIIWLTHAERRLGEDLWGHIPGRVVSMSIDTTLREPAGANAPYLLYCGRVDPNKGCAQMFDYFIRYKKDYPSELRLVLAGKDDIPVPLHPDIEFRGFVPAEEKFGLMGGAELFLMPSPNESFSIVTLEAMAQRAPVLANAAADVLADHITLSGAGELYDNYESFAAALRRLLSNTTERKRMGEAGRAYVVSRYTPEQVRASLVAAVEACAAERDKEWSNKKMNGFNVNEPADYLSASPPLPLPRGWTEEDLHELIVSTRIDGGPEEELRGYAEADYKRFIYTLGLVPETPGLKILELGANPYFTTVLLSKFREADLSLSNFFDESALEGTQHVTVHQTGERFAYDYKHFNMERDSFPYADDAFDLVLFCEIIEHLFIDPVHALTEIKRVLKPGGTLILTTPNAARTDNVRKIIAGENIYDPYSGYGPYGRHNREYTERELSLLLMENGFRVENLFTADVNLGHTSSPVPLSLVAPLVKGRRTDLGQYIFSRSHVDEAAKRLRPARPDWLYRSMHNKDED